MIVHLEEHPAHKEPCVRIQYARMDDTIKRLETLIKSVDKMVRCYSETGERWIHAADIYYIESVDKRTFVYVENQVFSTAFRLYQLCDELFDVGFVQVSKSCILNINCLSGIRPLMNSRIEATLSNGERIHVTRKYIPAIRKKLQER